ncbi:MAG: SDR family NAD(P)-dependent oxidoreductase, partial [Chloroflexota bacterium]
MNKEGKVAVVTGGANGIGRAIALRLAAEGAGVVVADTDTKNADRVASEIKALGGEALAVAADIREGEAVKAMFSRVTEEWGKVDILVNNAGITRDELILRMSESSWDDVLAINLRGAYLCTKAAL